MVQFTRKKKAFHTTKQPRKKRKAIYTAALHESGKWLNGHLSKELRQKMKKRSERVRTGDKVKVLLGKHRGKVGKVLSASAKTGLLTVEGVSLKKQAGREIFAPIPASNVVITELVSRDKQATKAAEAKKETKKEEKKVEHAHDAKHDHKKE